MRQVGSALAAPGGCILTHGTRCPFSMTLFLHRHASLSLSCPPTQKRLWSHRGFSTTADSACNTRPRKPETDLLLGTESTFISSSQAGFLSMLLLLPKRISICVSSQSSLASHHLFNRLLQPGLPVFWNI